MVVFLFLSLRNTDGTVIQGANSVTVVKALNFCFAVAETSTNFIPSLKELALFAFNPYLNPEIALAIDGSVSTAITCALAAKQFSCNWDDCGIAHRNICPDLAKIVNLAAHSRHCEELLPFAIGGQ
jgi:hypothetical protein